MAKHQTLTLVSLLLCAGGAASAQSYTAPAQPVDADEVRAVVSEMLADAQTRSSLVDSAGPMSGHDEKGFYLADGDGFRLNIGGLVQFRYDLNFRDADDGGPNARPNRGNDDFESGFQTTRTKLWFTGNIASPNLTYRIQGAFDRASGLFRLDDAYATYRCDCGLSVTWGQFKEPFLREELVGDAQQLAADRSIVNAVFTQDRSQGVMVGYEQDWFRGQLAFTDGFRSRNTEVGSIDTAGPFGFAQSGGEADWALSSRLSFKLAGSWSQFTDFTSFAGSEFAAMIGVAGHVQQSANRIAFDSNGDGVNDTEGRTTYGGWTIDYSMMGDAWTFYIAGVGAHADTQFQSNPGVSTDDYGLVAQFGIFVPDTKWEPFIRYDGVFQDDDRAGSGNDTFSTITVGANYFWSGQAARFTVDVQWFLDHSAGLVGSNSALGFFNTPNDNEVTVRFQFQLIF